MKFAIRNGSIQDHNRYGTQIMVQRTLHLARLIMLFQIKMRHLAIGMHAGIGASRTRDGDARA